MSRVNELTMKARDALVNGSTGYMSTGAALTAGKVLRRLRDCGFISSTIDDVLSRYDITQNGRSFLSQEIESEKDPRQLSLI